MTTPRLEFGNLDHIKLAERGMQCKCGHAKSDHGGWNGGCRERDRDAEEWCTCDCGDEHLTAAECECKKFEIDVHMKFNTQTNTFTK